MSTTETETEVTETTDVPETDTNEVTEAAAAVPKTFDELRRAIWMIARSEWDGLDDGNGTLCLGGVNGVMRHLDIVEVDQREGYFDAWLAFKQWGQEPLTPEQDTHATARLRQRLWTHMDDERPVSVERINRWFEALGIDKLKPARNSKIYQIEYVNARDVNAGMLAEVLNEKFPELDVVVRRY